MAPTADELTSWLSAASAGRSERGGAAAGVAAALPWVHRTGSDRRPEPWNVILAEGVLRARPTSKAECAEGLSRAAFLFLGCAAFPHGLVVLLFDSELRQRPGTLTLIDSGGLLQGRMIDIAGKHLEGPDAAKRWLRLRCDLKAMPGIASAWIAAHFDDPLDYVRRPLISDPDYPVAHQIRSESGHRLSWTIEAQMPDDVPLDDKFLRLVLARKDLVPDVPDAWLARVVLPPEEDTWTEADFDQYVAVEIERLYPT